MNVPFESFNARNLRAQDVASTFVASDDFARVSKPCHTIILGPRGSGKTTLLKMLMRPALEVWSKRTNKSHSLPFTSIYIPTDIVWHHEFLFSEEHLQRAVSLYQRISNGAVTIAVLTACVETFMDVIEISSSGSKADETKLCESLIRGFTLPATIPKLSEIHLELKGRMLQLGTLLNRAISESQPQTLDKSLPDWCDMNFLEAADYCVVAFDSTFGYHRENRWALCFDELELAPVWLQRRLFKFPRSTSQKLFFKLSSSPDPEIFSLEQVTPSDDVELVKLWRSSMVQRRRFCHELTVSVMARKGFQGIDPHSLFGDSDEDEVERSSGETDAKRYEQGSAEWELIKEVASWDASLASLLRKKGIDPAAPTATPAQRDAVLRKIKPIAALRKKFAKVGPQGNLVRRGRKAAVAYFGVPAIYDVSDGNPRRLIRAIEEICVVGKDELEQGKPVPRQLQTRAIRTIANLFRDYLKMLPGSSKTIKGTNRVIDLYLLLRERGRYFSSGLLVGPFPLDPKGSFTVDEKVLPEIIELLRLASYHGGIVKVGGSESEFSGNLQGRRFRLCFTLSPLVQLPLRLYEPRDLSACLANEKRFIHERPIAATEQLQLGIDDARD